MTPFIGQIQPFGFNFNPRGWAKCDGQLLAINQNDALFSLLGTIYGGDGRTTFGLPDLRGRVPVHTGSGPGLTTRPIGQKGGSNTNRMNTNTMAAHGHGVAMPVSEDDATTEEANGNVLGTAAAAIYSGAASGGESLQAFNTGMTGSNTDFNNMQPYLVINICIALQGVYPSRN